MRHNITIKQNLAAERLQIKETALVLVATILLPVLTHLFPYSGQAPVGAVLLPIFIAPLVAAFYFRSHVAVLAGALAPFANMLLTGQPGWHFASVLSFELIIFSTALVSLRHVAILQWVLAPLALLLAKLSSYLLVNAYPGILPQGFPVSFDAQGVATMLPGIVILSAINLFIISRRR
jgi:hypothetical protein